MAYPTEAKNISVRGLAGANRVRFQGTIPHGSGTREVAIDVHPDLIVKIAAALRATYDHSCDNDFEKRHRHHSEMGYVVGHAMWHVDNPDRPMPCVHLENVIDVGSLSAGPELVECSTCLGTRSVLDDAGDPRKCLDCNGEGKVPA